MDTEVRECSIANALEVVGERWAILAIREVSLGVHRFDDIVRRTGASRDILATRLRSLVANGVLEKRLYNERPPRYEYHLTRAGQDFFPVLLALTAWGDKHVTEGPPPTRWTHKCGARLKPSVACAACGEVVTGKPADVTVKPARPKRPGKPSPSPKLASSSR